MKLVVIDGQSGRMGQVLIERVKAAALTCEIVAVGTNAIATSAMLKAVAVGQSPARKLLLPVNHCNNVVVGTQSMTLSKLMDEAVELLRAICGEAQ